jgi:hypothetical protein
MVRARLTVWIVTFLSVGCASERTSPAGNAGPEAARNGPPLHACPLFDGVA